MAPEDDEKVQGLRAEGKRVLRLNLKRLGVESLPDVIRLYANGVTIAIEPITSQHDPTPDPVAALFAAPEALRQRAAINSIPAAEVSALLSGKAGPATTQVLVSSPDILTQREMPYAKVIPKSDLFQRMDMEISRSGVLILKGSDPVFGFFRSILRKQGYTNIRVMDAPPGQACSYCTE